MAETATATATTTTTVFRDWTPDGVAFPVRRRGRSRRGRTGSAAEWRRFGRKKWRLLLFEGLFLLGVAAGVVAFCAIPATGQASLAALLDVSPMPASLTGMVKALTSACFLPGCLLVCLFVSGLSVCGLPVAVLTPLFYGLGIGLLESLGYARGWQGVAYVLLMVLPSGLLAAVAMAMACSETMRMSLLLTGHMTGHLTAGTTQGALRSDFSLYCVRFLIFSLLVLAAGILRVLPRLLCGEWLMAG